jgi:hypothetical protein
MDTPASFPAAALGPGRLRRAARGLVLVAIGLLLAFGYKVVEMARENAELRAVRRAWQSAAEGGWQREVAFTGTPAAWALVRSVGNWFQEHLPAEAQWGLSAMEEASVGVYRLKAEGAAPAEYLSRADAALERRGWSRRVGVCEAGQMVGVYTRGDVGRRPEVCVVVADGRQVVLVSGRLRREVLADLSTGPCLASLGLPWDRAHSGEAPSRR